MPLTQLYPPSIARRQRGGDDDDDDDDDSGRSRHNTNTSSGITGTTTGTSGSSTPTNSASIGDGGKKGANGGAIAGGVIAGLVVMGLLVFLWWRRRMRRGRYPTTAVLDNESLVEHKNHSPTLNTASSGGAGVIAADASAVHRNISSENREALESAHSGPECLGTRASRQMTVANPDASVNSGLSTALGDIKVTKSVKSGSVGAASAVSRKSTEAAGLSSSQRDSEAPSSWRYGESDMAKIRQSSRSPSARHDLDNTSISSGLSNPYSLFDNQPAGSQGTTTGSNPPNEKRRSAPVHLSANDYPIVDDRSTSPETTTTADIFELQRRVEALQRENEMLHLDAAPPAYQ
uniref:Uncharacterized protein n=1 Tax=Moniliophthora roreri TaxID=221103 RepID=A0A0W0FZS9_MONRR